MQKTSRIVPPHSVRLEDPLMGSFESKCSGHQEETMALQFTVGEFQQQTMLSIQKVVGKTGCGQVLIDNVITTV